MLPGSTKVLPDNTSVVFVFFGKKFTPEGVLGPPLFVPYCPMEVEGKKNHVCGSCTFVCFGTSCASESMGLVIPCRGVIDHCVADVEDT